MTISVNGSQFMDPKTPVYVKSVSMRAAPLSDQGGRGWTQRNRLPGAAPQPGWKRGPGPCRAGEHVRDRQRRRASPGPRYVVESRPGESARMAFRSYRRKTCRRWDYRCASAGRFQSSVPCQRTGRTDRYTANGKPTPRALQPRFPGDPSLPTAVHWGPLAGGGPWYSAVRFTQIKLDERIRPEPESVRHSHKKRHALRGVFGVWRQASRPDRDLKDPLISSSRRRIHHSTWCSSSCRAGTPSPRSRPSGAATCAGSRSSAAGPVRSAGPRGGCRSG